MSKERAKLRRLVRHPRYGDEVVESGVEVSAEVVRRSFWRYAHETIFPKTAIAADVSRQNFAVFPRGYYVDILKKCQGCGRGFLFFAREQQYWYETLRFNVDADCVRCPECRRSERRIRSAFERYSQHVGRRRMSDEELAGHVDDLCVLLEAGIVQKVEKASWAVAAARRRLAGTVRLKRLEECLARGDEA